MALWKRNVFGVRQRKPVRSPSMRAVDAERGRSVQIIGVLKICCIIACWGLALSSGKALAEDAAKGGGSYPVGMKQMEYVDPADGRHLAFTLFYPAALADNSAAEYRMPFFANLHLYMDAPVVADTLKRPLVMFSHGAGSNGLYYAWFGEYLATRGYLVAMLYHYRANTYDSTVMYTRSKLWQRPRDVSLDITNLLHDRMWGPHIDPNRIGVAGHSQGGFTSLWLGGARVNPDLYLAYQKIWRNNPVVPAYLRKELPLDASPARDVRDSRIKAAFAMAPGEITGFGMDEAGLRQLAIPTYIIVGARDTQTPPKENAEFAAKYIPRVQLDILSGLVDHEIFVNECDGLGRDTWPEACIDASGVDRSKWHDYIGKAALRFFDAHLGIKRESAN
jgi:predicted dienelactone hydrolase